MSKTIMDELSEEADRNKLYTPETVMSWSEMWITLLVAAVTAAFVTWFCVENWPRFVAWLSF